MEADAVAELAGLAANEKLYLTLRATPWRREKQIAFCRDTKDLSMRSAAAEAIELTYWLIQSVQRTA